MVVLGFGFAFYKAHLQHDPSVQKNQAETSRLEGLAEMAKGFCQHPGKTALDEAAQRDVMQACAKAVVALAAINVPVPWREDALAGLEKGDAQGANALFQEVLERKSVEGKASNLEAGEAARNLGAWAFYNNTEEALAAYRKAVELDPDNWEGWNALGHLWARIGEMNEAAAAFGKVKTIAESRGYQEVLAFAHISLGVVYMTRGDLTQAEAMQKKALQIDETLGHKPGMAATYGKAAASSAEEGTGSHSLK